jgi:hypothetical protein
MGHQAFLIGRHPDGDVNVERFRRTASQLNYDVVELGDCAVARAALASRSAARVDGDRDLVMFCVLPDLRAIRDHLVAFRDPARRLIVYADFDRSSTDVAIEYCRDLIAHDFLVMGEHTTPDRLDHHIKVLHRGECPYARIDLSLVRAVDEDVPVFVSTPYDRENRSVMSDAVDPAMKAAGCRAVWADRAYREWSMPMQVLQDIRTSKLLIANISVRRPGALRHNPNVYYEAGHAVAFGVPVIFVRPTMEKDLPVPADISERRRIEYDNPVDLALRLYHGLRA